MRLTMPLTPRQKRWYWLLLLPLLNVFALPFYNTVEPTLFGIPFFYWYQLAWVVLCSIIVAIVFRMAHGPDKR